MSSEFWEQHWWLIIVLAAILLPVSGAILSAINSYFYYRHRRDALETLKTFAAQGKTPPPEVMDALGGRPRAEDPPSWSADPMRDDRYAWRAERYARRAARWRAREPYRRWNSAVFLVALTAGFAFASQHSEGGMAHAFMLVAIIMGAVAAGAVITALISTFMRPEP